MTGIIRFIRRDLAHLRGNVIALVVLVGIVVVPTFYAWFNIAGSWDPYANTKNLKVAVANNDEGYTSDLMPVELNIGERVVADLRESESIGYTVVSEDEALEGVRSGEYYAAVVIPENFSRAMMSSLSSNPDRAQLRFYQNDKANAIAEIVTSKASSAIQKDIDESFTETITAVGVAVLDDMGSFLDDDQVAELATKLSSAVSGSTEALSTTADTMRSFSALVASAKGLLGAGSGTTASSLSTTLDVGGTLRETAGGVQSLGDALDGTTDAVNSALASGAGSLDKVASALDEAFEAAGGQADQLVLALDEANALVGKIIGYSTSGTGEVNDGGLNELSNKLGTLYGLLGEAAEAAKTGLGEDSQIYKQITKLQTDVKALYDHIQVIIQELTQLSADLLSFSEDIATGKADATTAKSELAELVEGAKASIAIVQGEYESNVRGSLLGLATTINDTATSADGITAGIEATLGQVSSTASSAQTSLDATQANLDVAAAALDEAAEKLLGLQSRLAAALASGDLDQVRAVLASDPSALASFISSPVTVDRTAVYAVENNGSAMAPFYTTLAIWIGGVVLAALIKATPSEEALRETGCTTTGAYLARLGLFAGVGFLQSSLICAGDLYFLGVQCENVGLLFLACWAASFTFVNIIFALTASFGDVGKAVAVVLMVIQVAGSGGTFPREMLPGPFQAIYPFLPFVHSENAMRAAMFGVYDGDFWASLGTLLLFVVPSLVLGLVLRRPIIRANEWVERRLESTKLM